MPAQAPVLIPTASDALGALGAHIRQRRKALRVSATTAAESAGMSRVTLHRIERGEPSVTMGAYANAMAALGVQIQIVEGQTQQRLADAEVASPLAGVGALPDRINLADYPQLKSLAWHRPGATELAPHEALNLYERNWRHVDQAQLGIRERALIDALVRGVGKGHLLV